LQKSDAGNQRQGDAWLFVDIGFSPVLIEDGVPIFRDAGIDPKMLVAVAICRYDEVKEK
jgi:hypothetical protein